MSSQTKHRQNCTCRQRQYVVNRNVGAQWEHKATGRYNWHGLHATICSDAGADALADDGNSDLQSSSSLDRRLWKIKSSIVQNYG